MSQDFLVKRIRDSIVRIARGPERISTAPTFEQDDVRASIRLLARSRVSQILRQLRSVHNLTYADIQATTGLAQQLIYDVEFKDRRLSLDELRLLADCYNVTVEDILGIDLEHPTIPVQTSRPHHSSKAR